MISSVLIEHPDTYVPERRYIFDVIFRQFLGMNVHMQMNASLDDVHIRLTDDPDSRTLIIRDDLFRLPMHHWLTAQALPQRPVPFWKPTQLDSDRRVLPRRVPVLYGSRATFDDFIRIEQDRIELGVDVFGSAFFFLTRYEEVLSAERDSHCRFPAYAAIAYQERFLMYPVVDELVEVLWACMKRLWRSLERGRREYRVVISHDIEQPWAVFEKPWYRVLGNAAADLLQRRDVSLVYRRLRARFSTDPERYAHDPYNTFRVLADVAEKHSLRSAFYFKTGWSDSRYDIPYAFDSPDLCNIARELSDRGTKSGSTPVTRRSTTQFC